MAWHSGFWNLKAYPSDTPQQGHTPNPSQANPPSEKPSIQICAHEPIGTILIQASFTPILF